MKNVYLELKKSHQKEVNDFPMSFAFDNKQFAEGMQKLGLNPKETNKIYKFGDTGGFYRKTDAEALHEMFNRHRREMEKAIAADQTGEGFILDMFSYELANHEYVITYSVQDTLNALGLTEDQVNNNPALLKGLKQACKEQQEYHKMYG